MRAQAWQVVDQATAQRRELIAAILAKLPPQQQRAAAEALRAFAEAAGEVPDSQWPVSGPPGEATVPRAPVHGPALH